MLPAIVVLTIMIIPITSSICRELFVSVPRDVKEASIGLGATRWEMVRGVVVPYVRGGVVAAITLGLGRALGEAIAVTQVIGNTLQPIGISLFGSGNTLASQLAGSYQSAPTNIEVESLLYLALILLAITFMTNVVAQLIVQPLRPPVLRSSRDPMEATDPTPIPPFSLKATGRSRRRLVANRGAEIGATLAALLAVAVLVILVGSVFLKAFDALNWDFFTKGPAVFGETGGGIAPAIVGTVMLVAIATVIALPVGIARRDLRQRVRRSRSSPAR